MRHLMHAVAALCLVLPAVAQAQLQWQTSGVRQASHQTASAPAERARPAAKRPTVVRQAAAETAAQQAPVRQAVLSAPVAPSAPSSVHVDPAVQPACDNCDHHDHGYVVEGDACGVPGCGCGDEPGCGFQAGPGVLEPTCGCGLVGCGGACGDVCGDSCGGVPVTFILPPIRELTFETGVQAFKNPLDFGRDRGNFGANVGVNLSGAMSWLGMPGLGYQVGYRATFNQFHGDTQFNGGAGTADGHTQNFFTAGLFRRRAVGLQYGLVYDLLRDERQQSSDFGQLRGLVSVTNPRGHEIGFQFTSHTSDTDLNGSVFQAVDRYVGFYRMHACTGGEFRVFGGFDDDSKGILGGDLSLPLTDRWSLDTGFTYLIPESDPGADEEAWNIGMNLVWHYGHRARQSFQSQYRPLFRVADNGSLIVDNL